MLQAVLNAFKIADLRRKILFTLGMLVVFRIVAHVPVPGVDFTELNRALNDQTLGGLGLDSMGLVGVLSTQLLYHQFIAPGPAPTMPVSAVILDPATPATPALALAGPSS